MQMENQIIILISFIATVIGIYVLAPLTYAIGLTDKPCQRKRHDGVIPLLGGIVIYLVVTTTALIVLPITRDLLFLLIAAGVLVFTGAVDDKFNINFRFRLVVHAFAALIVVFGIGNRLTSLGDLVGLGEIELAYLSVPITMLAIIGIINAFNMIDGIDGLAGGLSLVAFVSLYILTADQISDSSRTILAIYIGSLTAYLLFNLHIFPNHLPKIFLGDSGSTLLGFSICTFLIRYSQENRAIFEPTTALWIVAIPLMDMAATFFRRIRKRKSPFYADRTHIHHIFLRARFTKEATLMIIVGGASMLAVAGLFFSYFQVSPLLSFAAFILCFVAYTKVLGRAFKVSKLIDKNKALMVLLKEKQIRPGIGIRANVLLDRKQGASPREPSVSQVSPKR
jgi:UDP-GlcNAc:undecaprenyl-phosphate/decaprenyl-phosphate GlcNAc-1-phosphate transferase